MRALFIAKPRYAPIEFQLEDFTICKGLLLGGIDDAGECGRRFVSGRNKWSKRLIALAVALLACVFFSAALNVAFAEEVEFEFSIPSGPADATLIKLAEQSDTRVLFPFDEVKKFKTNAVFGEMTVAKALEIALEGTGMSAFLKGRGVITVSVHVEDENNRKGTMKKKSFFSKLTAGVSSLVLAAVAADGAAADQADVGGASVDDNIIVSASRIKSSSFEAPTPVTSVTADDLEVRGVTNVADILNQLPGFQSNTTPQSTTLFSTTNGTNTLNLRGLGAVRTLVLVNGRRYVPTVNNGTVNINLIPQALISKVDSVTGGASAAWGSDAVAGVVNIGLDDKFTGARIKTQFGVSNAGDAEDYLVSMLFGGDVNDGRGHLVVGAEFNDSQGAGSLADRDWSSHSTQLVTNPANTSSSDGIPAQITVDDATLLLASLGGHILNGDPALNFIKFDSATSYSAFNPGTVSGIYAIGGDGAEVSKVTGLGAPNDRTTLTALFDYDVAENVTFFFEGSFARSNARSRTVAPFSLITGPMTIKSGNPYIPDGVQAIMTANSIASFPLYRWNLDFGVITADNRTDVWRTVAGFKGNIFSDWDYELYYQYGRTEFLAKQLNNIILGNLAKAVDVVSAPGTGDPICAATLAGIDSKCVPLNPFGAGSPSAAAIGYVHGTSWLETTYDQEVVSGSISGSLAELPAGRVLAAFGVEYREDSLHGDADELSMNDQWGIANFKPTNGSYNTKEIFGEVSIPLLSGETFVDLFEISGAVRYADYSSIGGATTWKAGGRYSPIPGVTFRGTYSRDIRAPNVGELYQPQGQQFASLVDPFNPSAPASLTQVRIGGNPSLGEERGTTKSAGVILQPQGIPGLSVSADWYQIDIDGAVGTLSGQDILDRCYAGEANLCDLIQRDSLGNLVMIQGTLINLGYLKTNGVDFEIDYKFGNVMRALPGDFTLQLLGNYTGKREVSANGINVVDYAGEVSPNGTTDYRSPHWRGSASLAYNDGPLGAFLQARYIGAAKVNNTYTIENLDDNSVAARVYLDLSARYNVNVLDTDVQVYGGVSNLLNSDPPILASTFPGGIPTNPVIYDVIGRYFHVGARVDF